MATTKEDRFKWDPEQKCFYEDRGNREDSTTVRVWFPKGIPQRLLQEEQNEERYRQHQAMVQREFDSYNSYGRASVAPQQMSIQEKFEKYHRANPHVYDLLVARARRLKADGRTKIGIGMITEQFRWNDDVLLAGDEGFKISNDYRSRYARLIMRQEPDLKNMFETRELTSL